MDRDTREKEEAKEPQRAYIEVRRSHGQAKTGIPVFFVRPVMPCCNRSHRFVGYDKMRKGIEKWFSPEINSYLVDDHVICSNNPNNALREYHRVCATEKIGKLFEVKLIDHDH